MSAELDPTPSVKKGTLWRHASMGFCTPDSCHFLPRPMYEQDATKYHGIFKF